MIALLAITSPSSHFYLVHVTPSPVFSRFDGPHDRVMDGLKMLRGVPIFRTVAASHVAAYEAHPQMDPRIAKLYAFFATLGAGLDLTDFFDVRAGISHGKRS
jgi:hypothetical protein